MQYAKNEQSVILQADFTVEQFDAIELDKEGIIWLKFT